MCLNINITFIYSSSFTDRQHSSDYGFRDFWGWLRGSSPISGSQTLSRGLKAFIWTQSESQNQTQPGFGVTTLNVTPIGVAKPNATPIWGRIPESGLHSVLRPRDRGTTTKSAPKIPKPIIRWMLPQRGDGIIIGHFSQMLIPSDANSIKVRLY